MRVDGHYILNGHEPIPCISLEAWAQWFENFGNRRERLTRVRGYEISTIFLGLDHGINGPPLLFETLVFGGYEKHEWPHNKIRMLRVTHDGSRCCTWDEATAMHKRWVKQFRLSRRQQKQREKGCAQSV